MIGLLPCELTPTKPSERHDTLLLLVLHGVTVVRTSERRLSAVELVGVPNFDDTSPSLQKAF